MKSIKPQNGFAVLTSAVLLSLAGIAFTTNMASTQLIDNKIVGNYYRNTEAFVNAESGINLLLSKIDDPATSSILNSLPYDDSPATSLYTINISRIDRNKVQLTSTGTSMDGSAQRTISLQVFHEGNYNIPGAPMSSNGKVNLDSTATLNEGCEGVSKANCKSKGNLADYQLVSNPKNEEKHSDLCTGAEDNFQQNVIDQSALFNSDPNDNNFMQIGADMMDENNSPMYDEDDNAMTYDWPDTVPEQANFFDADRIAGAPTTLFESTFGVTEESGVAQLTDTTNLDVARIDMTVNSSLSCSKQLQLVDPSITTIYIKGDCDIDQRDADQNTLSENKRFTIGTVENPKMIFIEGGTFITQPQTGAAVIGMLYYLPDTVPVPLLDDEGNAVVVSGEPQYQKDDLGNIIYEDRQSVDMGGVRVNGAMLSEYACSHDGYDKTDHNGTKQHFSARYDKTVLNQLYEDFGAPTTGSGYSFVEGSWRDF